jgi:uncharacterized protein (DUF2344 family)
MESHSEVFDLELTQHLSSALLPSLINQHLPSGLLINGAEEITSKKIPAPDTIPTRKYIAQFPADAIVPLPSVYSVKNAIAAFLIQKEFYVQVMKNGTAANINIRPLISHIALKDDAVVEIELNTTGGKIPRVTDILGEILNLGDKERKAIQITKLSTV